MTEEFDFLVIGAGMAGASVGYELSAYGNVAILEREPQPGYHSTGRSAAMFLECYGNKTVRGLTVASRAFFEEPPEIFGETPLLAPRGALFVGNSEQQDKLDQLYETTRELNPKIERRDGAFARQIVSILKPEAATGCVWDPMARAMDVDAIHQGYLRGFRQRGGVVITDVHMDSIRQGGAQWTIVAGEREFRAPIIVNAAGAWADEVAKLAGVEALGLQPMRRTAILFDAPDGLDISSWPTTVDVDEQVYFLPESGKILASPADETPIDPCDVQPDELDIATAAYRMEELTTLQIRRIHHKWAGLRSFFPDRSPVVGFDTTVPGFFWCAGQGGYGIQLAASVARCCVELIRNDALPASIEDKGIGKADLAPERLRQG